MKALEKAARARSERLVRASRDWSLFPGQLEEILPKAVDASWRDELPEIRAVIASIEVDDAMVEAAHRAWIDTRLSRDSAKESLRNALKAALHSILVDGEGR